MLVTFTRQTECRYGVDVSRESGPPARLRVVKLDAESLPREIKHFLVEREFGLKLGIFGQLAAGGDAGRFWAAPADRDSRLAHLSHRLQVTGRGDLGRSVALVAWCTAAWEIQTGRRPAGPGDPRRSGEQHFDCPWPLLDVAALPCEQVAAAVQCLAATAVAWHELPAGQRVSFDWPQALTLTARRSA
ncbi:MAG TPA: hypothetical protein VGL75_05705 [Acidothermaceae bacterium]